MGELEKAIKQLENPGTLTTYYHESNYDKAIKLGIEAMKICQRILNFKTTSENNLGMYEFLKSLAARITKALAEVKGSDSHS